MYITRKLSKNRILEGSYSLISNLILYLIRRLNHFPRKKKGNIVILSFHRLGDAVFTVPAVKEIITYYKDKQVSILTYPDSKSIYKTVVKEGSVTSVDKKEFKLNLRIPSGKVHRILRKLEPEILFDITGTIASALLITRSHASRVIGLNKKYYKSVYSDYISIRQSPDLMDRYLEVVKRVVPAIDNKGIKEFSVDFNISDHILINPFAGWKAKEWNLNKFIKLAGELTIIHHVKLICKEGQLPQPVLDELKFMGIPVIFTSTVEDLINEIKHCSLLIGNDTGPLHIANLLGKPTYAIFGPTAVEYAYIPGYYHKYIKKSLKCSPNGTQYCFTNAGLLCPAYECMNQLTYEEVKTDILSFINGLGMNNN